MVSLDDAEKNAAFAASLDGNFPLLSDPEKRAAEAYGVLGLGGLFAKRWTFTIDANGIIRHIDREVSTTNAGPDLVKRLEAIGIPRRETPATD